MDHGDPGNAGYAGVLVAVIGDLVLLGLYLACGSSSPVRIEYKSGTAAWVVGTLAVPSVQGHGLPLLQKLWPYQSLFSSFL